MAAKKHTKKHRRRPRVEDRPYYGISAFGYYGAPLYSYGGVGSSALSPEQFGDISGDENGDTDGGGSSAP